VVTLDVQKKIIDRLIREGYVGNTEDGVTLYNQLMECFEELNLSLAFGSPTADELWDLFEKFNLFGRSFSILGWLNEWNERRLEKRDAWMLPDDMKPVVEAVAIKIGVPVELLEFNKFRQGTMYVGKPGGLADFINITGDILADPNDPCPLKSIEAILAHEFYGHRMGQSHIPKTWRDEYTASYTAFLKTEDILSKDQRLELFDDAIYKIMNCSSELVSREFDDETYCYFKAIEDAEKLELLNKLRKERVIYV